ncbi:cilia- and flagella-associated protein HOATZ [Embiotoca jacksoni]|uniref:cilia- and flagella-associated protein HOATZ n=1 Tax=Embiotoca jacksoni TaxID=100190 RepID=UPI003704B645
MSVQPEPPEQDDVDKFFTVFEGSSPEDVSNARQLWSSVSLQPPLESRLVSADIRQRLPVSRLPAVSRPPRSSTAGPGTKPSDPEPPNVHALRLQQQEERQRYEAMAEQRKEILALQRRQREQRIQKELLRAGFKPKLKVGRHEVLKPEEAPETEADKELVRRLQ